MIDWKRPWLKQRSDEIQAFIDGSDWRGSHRAPLAGDASNRRYERLAHPKTGQSAVLMDAPPDRGEDVRPFCHIGQHLSSNGLSAPEIYAEDSDVGLLILEDLGDALLARVVAREPAKEHELYAVATDVLIALHACPPPNNVESYHPERMAALAELAFREYAGAVDPDQAAGSNRFLRAFEDILEQETSADPVLILRDYHAENLLWLPERNGAAKVGLLDFQDAMLGHAAYDLMSLLQDARRDVSPAVEIAMIDRYLQATGVDEHRFRTAYAVLGAQRHLRVLGTFARLCTKYGKPHYLDWIPRVWDLLMADLEHPALAPVSGLLRERLPVPSNDVLDQLRAKCPAP